MHGVGNQLQIAGFAVLILAPILRLVRNRSLYAARFADYSASERWLYLLGILIFAAGLLINGEAPDSFSTAFWASGSRPTAISAAWVG